MMRELLRFALLWLALLSCGLASAQSTADAYPSRLIRLVSPYPPGGLTDLLARVIAEKLQAAFGQAVIVENKPGLGTLLAAEYVAKSAPDGYTLGIANTSTFGVSPLLFPNFSVKPAKDLTPIARIGATSFFLISNASLPARNVREFIELARKNPGKFNYASLGSGTPHHLFMELLKSELGLNIEHIAYKGSAPALIDLLSGKVHVMFVDGSLAVPNIQAGKVIGLGTSKAKQTTLISSVPTIEATVPGFDWEGWQGIAGPAGMPWSAVTKIAEVLRRFQTTQEYQDLMIKSAMEPLPSIPPEQMADFVNKDLGRWAAAVKISGAKAE